MSLLEKIGKNAGSLALVGIMGAMSSSGSFDAIYVDPSWSFDEINNILDGDPNTLGKDGQVDAVAGDEVVFRQGVYQVPLIRDAKFKSNIDGISIFGEGPGVTIFRGSSPNSGLIWEIQGEDIEMGNFSMEYSRGGLKVSGDRAYDFIHLFNIASRDLDIHYIYDQQKAESRIDYPSIYVDHLNILGGTTAFHRNDLNWVVDYTDKFIIGDNITIDGTGNGIEPPMIIENGHVVETRGTDWRNCLFMNMQAPFIPRAYEGMPGRLENRAPSFCGESNIEHETFYQLGIGVGNWEENDISKFLDENGRPIRGSVATGPQYVDRNSGWFVGYAGAIPFYREPVMLGRIN